MLVIASLPCWYWYWCAYNRKAGRGHRQKGGGTVAKSRGDIFIPSADMWRKEAERFPSELLQTYCQKNKLPRAHVMARQDNGKSRGNGKGSNNSGNSSASAGGSGSGSGGAGGNWKGTVKMPDPKKKTEKDRWFRTVESFPSAAVAKQSASLLVRSLVVWLVPHAMKWSHGVESQKTTHTGSSSPMTVFIGDPDN